MIERVDRRVLRPTKGAFGVAIMSGFGLSFLPTAASNWLKLLLVGLALAVAVDAIWANLRLRHPEMRVLPARDAEVGVPSVMRLAVERPRRSVSIQMSSIPGSPLVLAEPPEEGTITVVPPQRGVFGHAIFDLQVAGPLGLVSAATQAQVRLPHVIEVGPQPVIAADIVWPASSGAGSEVVGPGRDGEVVRTVREYEPGDSRRNVHWPATAHSGRLMVRELDALRGPEAVMVVDLGPDEGALAERVAGRAAWAARDAIGHGYVLTMVTRERGGTIAARALSATDISRRLARAVPGAPPAVTLDPAVPSVLIGPEPA